MVKRTEGITINGKRYRILRVHSHSSNPDLARKNAIVDMKRLKKDGFNVIMRGRKLEPKNTRYTVYSYIIYEKE